MPLYENTFIVRQVASPNQVEELATSFSDVVRQKGGQVTKVEQWGLRTLAYRVQKNKKGHYVHMNIDAPAAALQELERNQRLNENVLRFLTVKVEELEAGPSAMMRKETREGDDEFGGREGGRFGDREGGREGGRGGDRGGRGLRPRADRAASAPAEQE